MANSIDISSDANGKVIVIVNSNAPKTISKPQNIVIKPLTNGAVIKLSDETFRQRIFLEDTVYTGGIQMSPFTDVTALVNYLGGFFPDATDGSGSSAFNDLHDQVDTLVQYSSDQSNYNSANNVAIANLNFSTASAASSAASASNLAGVTNKKVSANTTLVTADWGGKGTLYIEGNATAGALTIVVPLSNTCAGLKLIIGKVDSSANAITINKNASDASIGGSVGTLVTTQTVGSQGTSLRFVPNLDLNGWFKI